MALEIKGLEAVVSTLRETDRRLTTAAKQEVEVGAKAISSLARALAPVDTGNLESAIRARKITDHTRTAWRVGIQNRTHPKKGIGALEYVWEALRMGITDGSRLVKSGLTKPGKKSREKAKRTGQLVGGDFLGRAFRGLKGDIQKRIAEALKQEVKKMRAPRKK